MAVGDPGTRTAPAMTAAATDRAVVLYLIDSSGDLWAQRLRVPIAATAGAIEGYADAYAASSQLSLYQISDEIIRAGAKSSTNANTDQRNSAKDGVNMLWNNTTTHVSQTTRVVGPVLEVMEGDTDIPIVTEGPLFGLIFTQDLLTDGFAFQSAQYTERRERKNNPRVGQ